MEKMTKRDYFAGLAEIVKANLAEGEGQIYLDFIDRELALLDKRKENAQRRAEKKRAASDDLTEQIFDIIDAASGELVDVEAIMESICSFRYFSPLYTDIIILTLYITLSLFQKHYICRSS